MVRSGGGIEWLILIYIYYTKIYVTLYNLKCIANFESQKLLQNSMLWRSSCFYIVTFVHWNIMFIESCMYKSVLGKINKLQKKTAFINASSPSVPMAWMSLSSLSILWSVLKNAAKLFVFLCVCTKKGPFLTGAFLYIYHLRALLTSFHNKYSLYSNYQHQMSSL